MRSRLVEPLRHRDFTLLTCGRTFTHLGDAIAPIALAFAVFDLTGSLMDIGIVVAARSIASVVLFLFGGMLADRLPRSMILQGTEIAAAVTQGLIAVSVLCGFASIPLFVVLSVCNGAVAALSLPAAAAITPQTVPARLLAPANALVRMGSNTGRFTGAAIGGMLVATLGAGTAIAANAGVFGLAALSYAGIRLARTVTQPRIRPLADLAQGWREFTARRWVWLVVLQFMVVNAVTAGTVGVLGPAIADDMIGRAGWGFALAAQTAGAFFGGIVVARWQPRRALLVGVAVTTVDAVPLITLAEAPALIPVLLAMFVAGVALEQFVVAWDVSLQENIPSDRLARVYSFDMLGSFIALPVGELAAGTLATHLGRETTLLAGAALILLVSILTLGDPQVRKLTRKAPPPETGPPAR